MSTKTGFPSVDKPWLKYYTQEQINADLPKCKAFDYIWKSNKDHQSRTALNYFDRKITYGQLFSEIERAARAFSELGVRKGEIVSILSVTLPETIYAFYGLNRIGAISNMIDPRTSVEGIRDYIKEVNSKIVVVIDAASEKVFNAIEGTSVQSVVIISPADSLPAPKKQLYCLFKQKRISKHEKAIRWSHFIKLSGNRDVIDTPYEKAGCCVIVHTGGTTGVPKGVMLSDDNLNCSAFQCYNSPISFKREHRWIDIMPPFIAYGVGNGLHLPLATGAEIAIIPAFDPDKFDDLMLKYRPVHMVGVPSHYEKIINSNKLAQHDMSYIIAPVVGGDSMPIKLEKSVNEFFAKHNCTWNVVKGYGMTEVCAAVSVGVSNESNKLGSVGIPFAHTIISIFDPETGKELGYNSRGEICMTGPNTMLGYYRNEIATNDILRKHDDGMLWVHSGDLGYIDEDGALFIDGRMKRMIVRYDGFKVYPNLIESVIQQNNCVKACCVVGTDDCTHSQGRLPVAYVVLKDQVSKDTVLRDLKTLCEKELPEYAQLYDIAVIDKLPLTPIGKVDYRRLEESASQLVK